jgi:hypothetical protein
VTAGTPCVLCGLAAIEAHHITGKPPAYLYGKDRPHIDPDLTVPVCKRCHKLLHEDLRSQGIDIPADGLAWTVLDLNEFRLARLACFLGRLADVAGPPWAAELANVLRTSADELDDHRRALDHHVPDWAQLTNGESQ